MRANAPACCAGSRQFYALSNVLSKLRAWADAETLCGAATKSVIQRTRLFFRAAVLKIRGNIGPEKD